MGDQDNLYVIESIVDKRFSTALNSWRYQIKWRGFPSSENTWEPEETVLAIPGLLEQFEEKLKRKQILRQGQNERRRIRLREMRQKERELKLLSGRKIIDDDPYKKLKMDDLLPNDDDEFICLPEKKRVTSWKEVNENLNKKKEEKNSAVTSHLTQKKTINSYGPKVPVSSNNNNSRFKAEIPRKIETANREIREEASKIMVDEGVDSIEIDEEIEYRTSSNSNSNVEESNMEEGSETDSRISYKSKEEITNGNWKDLQPARILGCRKLSGEIYYAVLFRIKKDGTIPPILIVSHKDMKINAPKMLDSFLLENMIIC